MAQVAANGARQPLLQLLRGPSGKLWEVCIGLEVHAQVQTRSKLMSGAAAYALVRAAQPPRQLLRRGAAGHAAGHQPRVRAPGHPHGAGGGRHGAPALVVRAQALLLLRSAARLPADAAARAGGVRRRAALRAAGVRGGERARGAQSDDEATFDASKYKSRKEKNEALRKWKAKQAKKQQQEVRAGGILTRKWRCCGD